MQKALQRDRERRYQSGTDMITAIELYLYSEGHGPTNEKMADYLRNLFADPSDGVEKRDKVEKSPCDS